jgi:transposase
VAAGSRKPTSILGKQRTDTANRNGVAERVADPAVQKTMAVDLGLITDLARSIAQTAQHHDAHTFYRLRSIPGVGKILALVMRYAIHALHRFPSVQDFVSYCRLVTGARASAGKRSGTSRKNIGHAPLMGARAEVAVRFRRHTPAGQPLWPEWNTRLARAQH